MLRWALSILILSLAMIGRGEAGVDVAAIKAGKPLPTLGDYGFFDSEGRPVDGVIPYTLNMPLFTDYAEKFRFLFLPPGMAATYHPNQSFDFPVGTALIKSFGYPDDMRVSGAPVKLIETRLMLHSDKGWKTYPYVWDEAETEARLALAGKKRAVSWIAKDGTVQQTRYVVPNTNQCKGCHINDDKVTPIGPKARHLNGPLGGGVEGNAQLQVWADRGLLAGLPSPGQWPKVPSMDDTQASLDEKAKAYLDINCGHCHSKGGPADTSGLYLDPAEKSPVRWGIKKRPVAAGRGSGGFAFSVDPGHPDRSILMFRMTSSDPGIMMPELGRTMVHREGVELIRDWIESLDH